MASCRMCGMPYDLRDKLLKLVDDASETIALFGAGEECVMADPDTLRESITKLFATGDHGEPIFQED